MSEESFRSIIPQKTVPSNSEVQVAFQRSGFAPQAGLSRINNLVQNNDADLRGFDFGAQQKNDHALTALTVPFAQTTMKH